MRSHSRSGFSLIQMSIVLTVGALLLAASLPGGGAGDEIAKTRITMERMAAIEKAAIEYMARNQRRPYPSDITADFSTSAYGLTLTLPTDYSSVPTTHYTSALLTENYNTVADSATLTVNTGTVSASIKRPMLVSGTGIQNATSDLSWIEGVTSTTTLVLNRPASAAGTSVAMYYRNPVAAGGVPTKTLGLPDEYGLDGWGRRMVYMVDARSTARLSCLSMQNNGVRGAVALSNDSNFTTGTYDYTMWGLLSYGKDGQGAVGIQGSSLSNRIKTGNTDAATLSNAFYDSSQVTTFVNGGLVNKAQTSTFDDIVWVNERTKNTCALGNYNPTISDRDFFIQGSGSPDAGFVLSSAFGDINGDTYPDMVVGVPQQSKLRILMGKKSDWTTASSGTTAPAISTASSSGYSLFVNPGTMPTGMGAHVVTADVNGDGYDDILNGTSTSSTAYSLLLGAPNFPTTFTLRSSTFPSADIAFTNLSASGLSYAAAGDINNDGYADLLMPFDTSGTVASTSSSKWGIAMIFGKASGWADTSVDTAFLINTATNGNYLKISNPTYASGDISFGANRTALNRQLLAVCNVNNDAYMDVLAPGAAFSTSNGLSTPSLASYTTAATGNSATSMTINKPSGTAEGDGLLMLFNRSTTIIDIPAPTGWTYLNSQGSGTNIRHFVYYKKAGPAEPSSYTFTSPTTSNMVGVMMRITGVAVNNLNSYFDAVTGFNTGGVPATSFTDPSVTSTADNAIILYTMGVATTAAFSGTPAGTTLFANATGTGSSANRLAVYSKFLTTAGASGTGVYTTATSQHGVGYTISLRPTSPQRMYLRLGTSTLAGVPMDLLNQISFRFPTLTLQPNSYDILGAGCRDINSDGYDDVLIYLKANTGSPPQEYIYTYFGNASPTSTNMETGYNMRFDLTASAPVWQDTSSSSIPYLLFGDMNSDARDDIIISRNMDDPNVTISGATFTVNSGTSGTTRTDAGMTYVLYQPSTCDATTTSTCWGALPLNKNFFSYNFAGVDGLRIVGGTPGDYISARDAEDMNKDGKTDLLISAAATPAGQQGAYFIFGKSSWPATYDLACIRDKTHGEHCPPQFTAR